MKQTNKISVEAVCFRHCAITVQQNYFKICWGQSTGNIFSSECNFYYCIFGSRSDWKEKSVDTKCCRNILIKLKVFLERVNYLKWQMWNCFSLATYWSDDTLKVVKNITFRPNQMSSELEITSREDGNEVNIKEWFSVD